jgi:hypothetical protein
MVFEKWGEGEGLYLHRQEDQDLCACAAAEELIFNTSSEHQTVNLSNKCMTGYVKLQTSEDTCEGVCAAKQRNENTREPRLPGLFEASH